MLALLQKLESSTNRFQFVQSRSYIRQRMSIIDQQQLIQMLSHVSKHKQNQPVVYEEHFHFFKADVKSVESIWYIKQIRDPLERALSQYSYRRYRCDVLRILRGCSQMDLSCKNLTLDQCISSGNRSRCVSRPCGVASVISFFCGQDPICDDTFTQPNTAAALSLAKTNIERYYSYVGLLEYFESSLQLLEYIHSPMFDGISQIYSESKRKRVNALPNKYRIPVSNETRSILRQLLKNEFDLYNFVQKRFIDQYRSVFGRSP